MSGSRTEPVRDTSGVDLGPAHPEVLALARGLSSAVLRDEAPQEDGFDISGGMYGTHVSLWLRRLATDTLNARLRQERLLRAARVALRYLHTRDQAADVVCQQLERALAEFEAPSELAGTRTEALMPRSTG